MEIRQTPLFYICFNNALALPNFQWFHFRKFILNGIFFGSEKAENVFIFVHGLGGSLFGHVGLAEKASFWF